MSFLCKGKISHFLQYQEHKHINQPLDLSYTKLPGFRALTLTGTYRLSGGKTWGLFNGLGTFTNTS